MLLPSLLKSGDQVYQKVIKQLYQKMLLLNLLITLLLEEGRIARHFHYVESGMLRQYYYNGFCVIFLPNHGICHYYMRLKGFGRDSSATILSGIPLIVSKMIRN